MTRIDLITGFLGSGKTTFIKKYARYLHACGERVGIIENDYGAVNVDMLLMNELKEEGIGLEMVAGGCDMDCHRRRFKTKLLTMALLRYDRVIVEPSGIFDVDEFFDLLQEDELYDRYEIANVLAVVNGHGHPQLSEEGAYMLASQAAQAGKVIFSFVQECDEEEIGRTKAQVRKAMEEIGCVRVLKDEDFFGKNWEELQSEDLRQLKDAGYRETSFVKKYSMENNGFTSLFFMNPKGTKEEILNKIKELFLEEEAGVIHRIKGFAKDDGWYEINAVKETITVKPMAVGQEILIVIGEQLNGEKIASFFEAEYSSLKTQ